MARISRIVAATDFSDFAEQAVLRAARIASQHAAELHLLHVVRPLDLYPGLTLAPDEFSRHDRDLQEVEQIRLDTRAATLASEFGLSVHSAARLGRAHDEIADYARTVSADLVVVGARGENTLMDLLLGSTASRLLRVATCPVLLVRKPADTVYQRVVAAVDFSPVSAAVVGRALALADDAHVNVLHVLGSEVEQRLRRAKLDQVDIAHWLARVRSEAETKLQALLAVAGNSASAGCQVETGIPPAAICQRVEEMRADLVVLGRHGHGGGLQQWLLGSVSKDVALAAPCDVLLVTPG